MVKRIVIISSLFFLAFDSFCQVRETPFYSPAKFNSYVKFGTDSFRVDSIAKSNDSVILYSEGTKYHLNLKASEISLNELNGNVNANVNFVLGGNTVTWTFTNPVGGMLFDFTGGWSGHALEILDNSNVPNGSVGDHLLHIETDRSNVIPAHFEHLGDTALKVSGITKLEDDLHLGSDSNAKKINWNGTEYLPSDFIGSQDSTWKYGEFEDSVKVTQIFSTPHQITYATSITFNGNNGMNQYVILTGNVTTCTFSNMKRGAIYTFEIIQDATGSRTFDETNLTHKANESVDFSTTASDENLIVIFCDRNGNLKYSISTYTP